MESALRPRDIQARIRGGESAEERRRRRQTSVEEIMGFRRAGARRARRTSPSAPRAPRCAARPSSGPAPRPRRGGREGTGHRNVDPDDRRVGRLASRGRPVDARRRIPSGESPRHAEFVFDPPGRYVVAENQEARWLIGEADHQDRARGASSPGHAGRATGPPATQDELPLGDDAIELVRDRRRTEARPRAKAERRLLADRRAHATTPLIEAPRDRATEPDTGDRMAPVEAPAEEAEPRPRPTSRARRRRRRGPREKKGTLLGPLLGRDHVRRRQGGVTSPGGLPR